MTNDFPRRGLSLMEVILSIAILGGSLATIGELIRVGARNAAEARDLATAQLYCESKMSEAAAGAIDLSAAGTEPLDETGEWMCAITTEAQGEQQLIAVNVTVGQNPDLFTRPVSFSMTQWIIDPAYVAECAALDAEMKAAAKVALSNASQNAGNTGGGQANNGDDSGSGGGQGGQGTGGGGQGGGGIGGIPNDLSGIGLPGGDGGGRDGGARGGDQGGGRGREGGRGGNDQGGGRGGFGGDQGGRGGGDQGGGRGGRGGGGGGRGR